MIIKSSAYLLIERVVNAASSIFTMVVAAQLLGAVDFGVYTYNTAVFGILVPLVNFGLNGILVRALLDTAHTQIVIVNALLIRFLAFATVAVGIGIITLFHDELSAIIIIALFGFVFQIFESYNQAFHRNHITAIVRSGIAFIATAVKIYLLWNGQATIELMLLIFALEFPVYFVCGFILSFRIKIQPSLLARSETIGLASAGSVLLVSSFAEIVTLRIDQVMIAEMIGTTESGQYAIAARLIEFPLMFAAVLAAAYFPKFYSNSKSPDAMFRNLRKMNFIMILFASVFVIILFFVGPIAIRIIFGIQYIEAGKILPYLLPCIYVLFFLVVASKWIVATGIYWYSLFSNSLGAIMNVTLNLIWIPEYGVYGAALASFISYSVACWGALLITSRTRAYLLKGFIG